ncbi:MAG TPA: hypothetical protein VEI94_14445 [Candidatus Bathyarchaeia archaeon]|nr:hypothetical protein [Candidatus Bathyarchaeia archaeon]
MGTVGVGAGVPGVGVFAGRGVGVEPGRGVGVGAAVGDGAAVAVGDGGGGGRMQLPFEPQASQQLGCEHADALPPAGARQASALRLMLHELFPFARVLQQATAPGRPQVDLATQRRTEARQLRERLPRSTAPLITRFAQRE